MPVVTRAMARLAQATVQQPRAKEVSRRVENNKANLLQKRKNEECKKKVDKIKTKAKKEEASLQEPVNTKKLKFLLADEDDATKPRVGLNAKGKLQQVLEAENAEDVSDDINHEQENKEESSVEFVARRNVKKIAKGITVLEPVEEFEEAKEERHSEHDSDSNNSIDMDEDIPVLTEEMDIADRQQDPPCSMPTLIKEVEQRDEQSNSSKCSITLKSASRLAMMTATPKPYPLASSSSSSKALIIETPKGSGRKRSTPRRLTFHEELNTTITTSIFEDSTEEDNLTSYDITTYEDLKANNDSSIDYRASKQIPEWAAYDERLAASLITMIPFNENSKPLIFPSASSSSRSKLFNDIPSNHSSQSSNKSNDENNSFQFSLSD